MTARVAARSLRTFASFFAAATQKPELIFLARAVGQCGVWPVENARTQTCEHGESVAMLTKTNTDALCPSTTGNPVVVFLSKLKYRYYLWTVSEGMS